MPVPNFIKNLDQIDQKYSSALFQNYEDVLDWTNDILIELGRAHVVGHKHRRYTSRSLCVPSMAINTDRC